MSSVLTFLSKELVLLFSAGIVLGVAISMVEIVLSTAIQAFFNSLGVTNLPIVSKLLSWIPSNDVAKATLFVFALATCRGIFQYFQIAMQNGAIERFKFISRSRILSYTFRSRAASTSHVTTLFSERTQGAASWVGQVLAGIVVLLVVAILGIQLFLISWKITLFLFVILAPLAPLVRALNKKSRHAGIRNSEEWEKTNRRLISVIKNLILVRIYNTQLREEKLAKESIFQYLHFAIKSVRISALLWNFPQVVGMGIICVTAYVSTKYHLLSSGELLAYFYLFVRFAQNVGVLNSNLAGAIYYEPQFKEVYHWWRDRYLPKENYLFATPSDTKQETPTLETPFGWTLSKASFEYKESTRPIFTNLDLEIPEGKATLIVGASGTGKSTLLNILLGELPLHSGNVTLRSLGKTYPMESIKAELLTKIGYVGPESLLVEGTVLENLCYGLQTVPAPSQLDEALRLAECGFINEMSGKLEHRLTEQGHGLSAGQKQRLSLARALLRNPKALILDEATSNLDVATEQRLVETLSHLKAKMTLVIVTHRESLLALADHLVRL